MSNVEGSPQPISDASKLMMFEAQKKSMGVAYLLLIFLGGFGAHRFYLGRTGSAVAMLIIFLLSILLSVVGIGLLGFLAIGIWCFIDLFLIPGIARQHNMNLANMLR
ncbi:MAG TPA: TM2 domain-containing protein [Rhizomicrobium sp.]